MTMRHVVHLAAIIGVLAVSGSTEAAELAGAWNGVLSSPDGSRAEVQVDFSPQGLPLYSYTNNKGITRQVELSHVGQTIEYVPPGGGVQRMAVKRFEQGPGRVSISIVGSFERGESGLHGPTPGSSLV